MTITAGILFTRSYEEVSLFMEYIVDDQKLDVMDFIEFVNKCGWETMIKRKQVLP